MPALRAGILICILVPPCHNVMVSCDVVMRPCGGVGCARMNDILDVRASGAVRAGALLWQLQHSGLKTEIVVD